MMMPDLDNLSLVLVLERLAPRPDTLWLPRRLFPILWRILEHRYRKRPLPQKITNLQEKIATKPWPTLLALARWLEHREPAFADHVAEAFAGVWRVLLGAPDVDPSSILRPALRRLSTRRFSKGKPKSKAQRFTEAELWTFYVTVYECFEGFVAKARDVGWSKAIDGAFGMMGEDRPPSQNTLSKCTDFERRKASRSEVCLQITADLGNRSPETLAGWKSLRGLPPWTLTRHRRPRKTPLPAK